MMVDRRIVIQYFNKFSGTSSSIILWADYVARIPGSQFWSVVVFFTIFTLALSSSVSCDLKTGFCVVYCSVYYYFFECSVVWYLN